MTHLYDGDRWEWIYVMIWKHSGSFANTAAALTAASSMAAKYGDHEESDTLKMLYHMNNILWDASHK